MEAETYSYSKSKGLFAGISLKGASLQIDKDANRECYGRSDIEAKDILAGRGIEDVPSNVEPPSRAGEGEPVIGAQDAAEGRPSETPEQDLLRVCLRDCIEHLGLGERSGE